MFKRGFLLVASLLAILPVVIHGFSADVPYFLQYDKRWGSIRMNGRCRVDVGGEKIPPSIAKAGCTLTSAAMLFTALNVPHTPETMNECMDWYACPFGWEQAPGLCGEGRVEYVGKVTYTAEALQSVVALDLMPIMGVLHRVSGREHWVLVTGPARGGDYWIHDPDHVKLGPVLWSELEEDWRPFVLHLYRYKDPREAKPRHETVGF